MRRLRTACCTHNVLSVEVPQLAEALSGADSQRCRGIRPDSQGEGYPEMGQQRLISQAVSGAADDSIKLRFATAQNNIGLRGRPMLDRVAAQHHHAPRC